METALTKSITTIIWVSSPGLRNVRNDFGRIDRAVAVEPVPDVGSNFVLLPESGASEKNDGYKSHSDIVFPLS